MKEADLIAKIADKLAELEGSAIAVKLTVGEYVVAYIKKKKDATIADACNAIAAKVEKARNIERSGGWYEECYLYESRLTDAQKTVVKGNPNVTLTWLNWFVRQEDRDDLFVGITVNTKKFITPKAKPKAVKTRTNTTQARDDGVQIPFPIEVDCVEVGISRLYAEAKKALDLSTADIDKAIAEGKRRAGA